MEKSEVKIAIIGAGMSGLMAALTLESNGYTSHIFESTDRVGGRLKTDIVDGYQLDHGFQVLLEAYPYAQKYLDYKSLELQSFLPGSSIYNGRTKYTIGDPTRAFSFLIPTLFAGIGSLKDKLKILKLNKSLKRKSIDDIFSTPETSTLQYLKALGFSDKIINQFFKPFFTGIFLETELSTSSRKFEFIYKMFGAGMATLPKAGIEAIPKDLKRQLKTSNFSFNKPVKSFEGQTLTFEDGSSEIFDFIVIAAEASPIVANLRNQAFDWKSCETLYFEVEKRTIQKPMIGLSSTKSLSNNIFYHNSLKNKQKGAHELLSVTIVKPHAHTEAELVTIIEKELKDIFNIIPKRFLKLYQIKKALPKLNNISNHIPPMETRLNDHLFLAGDQWLNGSLNAAMASGESAALGIIRALEGGNGTFVR